MLLRSKTCLALAALAVSVSIAQAQQAQPTTPPGSPNPPTPQTPQPAPTPAIVPESTSGTAATAKDPLISPDPAQPVLQPWYDLKDKLDKDAALQINPSYTFLYQNATNVLDDKNDLFQGRLDLPAVWTPIKDGKNTGSLNFLLRSGENIFSSQNFAMQPAVGDDKGIDSLQGGGKQHPVSINQLYWRQSFLDDKLAFYIGKVHPNNHFVLDAFNNDETTQFLSGCFDGNSADPQIGNYSEGAAVEWNFYEDWYVHAMAMSASGAAFLPPNHAFDGRYYEAVGIGTKPTLEGLGKGHYEVYGWHANTPRQAPEDNEGLGIGMAVSQEIGGGWAPFARAGYGDPSVAGVEEVVVLGIDQTHPFGRRGDMWGIAGAWNRPSNRDLREEILIETFYRIKVTDSIEFSPDIELLVPPANRDNQDVVAIFGARLKIVL